MIASTNVAGQVLPCPWSHRRCDLNVGPDQPVKSVKAANGSVLVAHPRQEIKRPFNRTLSLREKQVVDLICKAKLNKEIAYELHLTCGTVKEYLNRIFRKVGATNRTELAVWAITTLGDGRRTVDGSAAMGD